MTHSSRREPWSRTVRLRTATDANVAAPSFRPFDIVLDASICRARRQAFPPPHEADRLWPRRPGGCRSPARRPPARASRPRSGNGGSASSARHTGFRPGRSNGGELVAEVAVERLKPFGQFNHCLTLGIRRDVAAVEVGPLAALHAGVIEIL